MHGRVGGANDIDLRHRAEGSLAGDAHIVAALHCALDLALDRLSGLVRVAEFLLRRGVAHTLPRERQPSRGRDDPGLNGVAHGNLEHSLRVLQLRDLDDRFTLAADVHEGELGTDRHNRPGDRLASLVQLRLCRRFEHRGKIFLELAHSALLVMVE